MRLWKPDYLFKWPRLFDIICLKWFESDFRVFFIDIFYFFWAYIGFVIQRNWCNRTETLTKTMPCTESDRENRRVEPNVENNLDFCVGLQVTTYHVIKINISLIIPLFKSSHERSRQRKRAKKREKKIDSLLYFRRINSKRMISMRFISSENVLKIEQTDLCLWFELWFDWERSVSKRTNLPMDG